MSEDLCHSLGITLDVDDRLFHCLGGAGLLTVTSVITTDLTSLRERGYYQGVFGLIFTSMTSDNTLNLPTGLMMVVFGLGASVGGPVSGWIADRFSWPWAFYAQVRTSQTSGNWISMLTESNIDALFGPVYRHYLRLSTRSTTGH